MKLLLPLLLILPLFAQDYTHRFSDDNAAIIHLLNEVERSEGVFIRNGDEHPAKKARQHLEHKMNMAKKMFWFFGPEKEITVQEFIEKIASKSSTTGRPYKIRLKDGSVVSTGDWLRKTLKSQEPATNKN